MHTFTHTVTAYVKLCQGVCIPSKSVTKYPNSNPLFSKTIEAKIKAKDGAFLVKSRYPELFHRTNGDLPIVIRDV